MRYEFNMVRAGLRSGSIEQVHRMYVDANTERCKELLQDHERQTLHLAESRIQLKKEQRAWVAGVMSFGLTLAVGVGWTFGSVWPGVAIVATAVLVSFFHGGAPKDDAAAWYHWAMDRELSIRRILNLLPLETPSFDLKRIPQFIDDAVAAEGRFADDPRAHYISLVHECVCVLPRLTSAWGTYEVAVKLGALPQPGDGTAMTDRIRVLDQRMKEHQERAAYLAQHLDETIDDDAARLAFDDILELHHQTYDENWHAELHRLKLCYETPTSQVSPHAFIVQTGSVYA